jgi:hypothetical protein
VFVRLAVQVEAAHGASPAQSGRRGSCRARQDEPIARPRGQVSRFWVTYGVVSSSAFGLSPGTRAVGSSSRTASPDNEARPVSRTWKREL